MASSSLYQTQSQIPVGVTTIAGATGATGAAGLNGDVVPIQSVSGSGAVILDYDEGTHVVLTLTGNITSLTFSNWPAAGNFVIMTVEVRNTGAYSISGYYAGVKWAGGGIAPTITPGGGAIDWLAFTTSDSGVTVYGHQIGRNFT